MAGGARARLGDGPCVVGWKGKVPAEAGFTACEANWDTARQTCCGGTPVAADMGHPSTQLWGRRACRAPPSSDRDAPAGSEVTHRVDRNPPLSNGVACAPMDIPAKITCSTNK